MQATTGKNPFIGAPSTAVEAVEGMLAYAISVRASDIHCDPRETDVLVRVRIDGHLGQAGCLPKVLHEEVISRLKILSGARTDLHAVPQDGRWRLSIEGNSYNARISFMPTYHGENAVIRLLPAKSGSEVTLQGLGFSPDHIRMISGAMEKTHGLILVTGPTGSGKTTTLHACLSEKAHESLSVVTLEDPVEYEIAGVRQIHIRESYGVSFAHGLRAALRQDPDVIMLGEIRDSETARVAIHTALTGHLVLSTLHTSSALEAIPRLIDMGIDRYLLACTLRLVIAQRLVRIICRECLGAGCSFCSGTGYAGRTVIAEVCEIDDAMRSLIGAGASGVQCSKAALERGYRPLEDDGAEKVEWGMTTREEILRVLHP